MPPHTEVATLRESSSTLSRTTPEVVRSGTAGTPESMPLGVADRAHHESSPRSERRRHRRTPPPSVLNGAAYSLRALTASVPLVVSDLTALLGAVLIASALVGAAASEADLPDVALFVLLTIGLVSAKAALGLYPAIGVHPVVEVRRSALATMLLVSALILAGFLHGADAAVQWTLFGTGVASLVLIPLFRALSRRVFGRFSWWSQPLLVFDTGPAAPRVFAHFAKNPGLGLRPVLVRPDVHENGAHGESGVARLASKHRAVCAALPLQGSSRPETTDLLHECLNVFPHLIVVPDLGESFGMWSRATNLGSIVGIRLGRSLLLPAPRAAKRVVDSLLTLVGILLCLPLLLVIAIAIKLSSPGPVFYGQERIGRDRKKFLAWKFRTMRADADEILGEYLASREEAREEWARDHKLKNDPRVTAMGRILRRTSLDELPQLWNVLRGDMSLVGPRPIVDDEVQKYGTEFGRYLSVPPGITGLWQVSGRNRTTYEERIRLDSFYVENWSLAFDAYILAKTVEAVATGDGAY